MEVVNWVEAIEELDTDETEVSLSQRPRTLPRHHHHHRDDNSVKSSEISSSDDESHSSNDGEDKANGKPTNGVFHGENGNGNGDSKSKNGHHGLDERYDDFLVSDETPVAPANDPVFLAKDVEVEAEIKEDITGFSGSDTLSSGVKNGVHADFLVSDEIPAEPAVNFEASYLGVRVNDVEVEAEIKKDNTCFAGSSALSSSHFENGVHTAFLVSDETPAVPAVSFEANDLVFRASDVEVEAEINRDNNGFTGSSGLSSSHAENGVQAASASNEAVRYMEAQLREKIEEEFRALYLEKLTDRTRQHDFYCPNCKACITKVLVAKRELEEESAAVPEPERVQERFRCTSCFSFLIPIGNWLFPSWRNREADGETNMPNQVLPDGLREPMLNQNSRAVPEPAVVPNAATPTIEIHERNTAYFDGVNEPVRSRDWNDSLGDRDIPPVVTSGTATIGTLEHNAERITEVLVPAQSRPWASVVFGQKIKASVKGRTPIAEEAIGVPMPAPTKPVPHSDEIDVVQEQQAPSSDTNENGKVHNHQHPVEGLASVVVSAAIAPVGSNLETGFKGEMYDKIAPILGQTHGDVLIVKSKPTEIDVVAVSHGDFPPLQEVIVHSGPNSDEVQAAQPEAVPVIVASRDTALVPPQDSPKSWEIAKSIVYGGLVESITSLGIVTSAASGDVTTMNITVLALANLIGGLFVIIHNIWDLKVEQSTMRCSRTNRVVDKYHETLGRRENFFLHAACVILSFIVFGLVPPVVYGLTFRESDDKDLKLAAVGAASLVCIAILAAGKAYIQRPSKYIKTIMYYIVIGVSVSGASYLAGELIRQILEKVNSSESAMSLAMPLPGTGSGRGNWGSF